MVTGEQLVLAWTTVAEAHASGLSDDRSLLVDER
jgi:hypothetical protein